MTSYYDIENCYKFILGRQPNDEEKIEISKNIIQLSEIPVAEHRQNFLKSPEFHHRHSELLFENFVQKSTVVLFETEDHFKIHLDLRQYHMSFGILSGHYERFDVGLVKAIVPDDGVFFDIGGNVGYYSLSVAATPGFTGEIVAFEPLPQLWQLFSRSIRENGFSDHITVHQLALADTVGELQLSDAETTINAGATRLLTGAPKGSGVVTPVETLDRMSEDLAPDCIKVDIEGAEGLFLSGASETIRQSKPTILMEINRDLLAILSKTTPAGIYRRLSEFGYEVWMVEDASLHRMENATALDAGFPSGKVGNVLAVHPTRNDDVRRRLKASGVTL